MADIKTLTTKIVVDTKDLKRLSTESKKLGSEFESAGKKGVSTFSQFRVSMAKISSVFTSLLATTLKWASVIAGALGGLSLGALIKSGIEYNKTLETSQLGIAAILASTQRVVNEQGRLITGSEKFAASLGKARDVQEQLQIINLQTSATSQEILAAFQGISAPAAAAGIEIEKQLELTKLMVQSTKALGLESNQVVQESRDLLSATVDRNSQLALALGITSEQLKQAKEQGRLFEFLSDKLSEFARAGELTQQTFAGMTSNLQDALSRFAGIGFSGLFEALKGHLGDITSELVTIENGQIKVNQKWLDMAETISDVLVGALDAAVTAAGFFFNAMSDGLDAARKLLAPPTHFGGLKLEVEATQASVDLLKGSYGIFIDDVKVSEGIYRDTSVTANQLATAMGNMSAETNKVAAAWVSAKGPMDDYFSAALEWLRKGAANAFSPPTHFGTTPIANFGAQQLAQESDVIRINRAYEKLDLTIGGLGERLPEVQRRFGKLNLTLNDGGLDAYEFASAVTTAGDETEGASKKANSLANEILKLKFEIAGIGKNPEELIALAAQMKLAQGESAKLVEEWTRLSILRQRGLVGQETLDNLDDMLTKVKEQTAVIGLSEGALRKHELAVLAANIEWEKLPQDIAPKVTKAIFDIDTALDQLNARETAERVTEGFLELMQDLRTESQKLGDELAGNINIILQAATVRPDLIGFEEANELIQRLTKETLAEIESAERQAYIDRLKASDSFFDQLKGGFLEFALSVESNGELAAQFFADTLSQMSQNFSDFFYNVLTGKFDDLVDVAKNAFRAILRAFLDMVAAIATRQIIVNIAGSIGIGKGQPGGAAGALGLGKDAVGLVGAGIGLFGGGAAAGGATAAAIGGAAGGVGSVGVSGLTAGIPVSTLAGGGSTGVLGAIGAAAPYVGAVLAAAALAYSILGPLLKKTPRLDIDFDSVKTDMGRRAAVVAEFLDPDFFIDNIGQVSVKRKAGLGLGGDEKILELIQQRIQETVEGIQDIIRRLPAELFNSLNETLLNAEIDIDTVIGGERLLEFDAKGKKVAEKFQAFIEGELPAKFFAAIRESFFDPAFQALGVSAEGTQQLIDDFMAKLEAAGSREERAIIGQEFIDTFSAFVDAFNIVSGNANDAIGQTMNTIKGLANQLGFEAVPSIEQLRMKLGELIENAELDPETVQMYADLRNAIVAVTAEIVNSISGLIGKMQSLNQTMASLGLATVDLGGYLSQAASQIQRFLQNNQGELSLSEQEAFLDQLTGIANAMLQEEMAAFNAEQERLRAEAQAAYEAQRAQIQGRIDSLNREKEAINETFRARIDALNEELKLAQDFAAATESIRNTLDGIIFSQQSIFTSVERVNMLQGNIADLQNQLANTDDPNRQLDLIGSLEDAFKTLFDTAGEAFGVNSPEFVSIFDQVTGGLSDLANLTENRGRSAEEIQAEIERLTAENGARLAAIDASIQAAQAQLSSLQQQTVDNTFVASQELQDLFSYIQSEYQRLLDERFAQLGEISEFGFQTEVEGLGAIAGLMDESLVTLKEQTGYVEQQLMHLEHNTELLETIANHVGGAPGFAGGSGGLKDFGDRTLAFLHGSEAVLTKAQYLSIMGSMEAAISLQRNFGNVLQSFTGAMSGIGLLNKFANEIQGGTNLSNLTKKLTSAGYISSLAGELPRTPEQVVRERTADIAGESKKVIEVIVHGDSPTAVQAVIAGVTNNLKKEVKDEIRREIDSTAPNIKGAVANVSRRS